MKFSAPSVIRSFSDVLILCKIILRYACVIGFNLNCAPKLYTFYNFLCITTRF